MKLVGDRLAGDRDVRPVGIGDHVEQKEQEIDPEPASRHRPSPPVIRPPLMAYRALRRTVACEAAAAKRMRSRRSAALRCGARNPCRVSTIRRAPYAACRGTRGLVRAAAPFLRSRAASA